MRRVVKTTLLVAAATCLVVFLIPQDNSVFDGATGRRESSYGMGFPGSPWWRLDTVSDPAQGDSVKFEIAASLSWVLLMTGLGLLWVRRRLRPPVTSVGPSVAGR